jgi:hypothetical protein
VTSRVQAAVVCGLLFFAFYFPSSVAGVISKPLSVAALLVTCVALAALAAGSRRLGPPAAVLCSVLLLGILTAATIVSPLDDISLGVVTLYVALALLYALDLREVSWPRLVSSVFVVINVISIVVGILIALDVKQVDAFLKANYGAFRSDLLWSMLDQSNKPVLTFATHSMAAFMIYLLLLMSLRTFEAGGRRWWLLAVGAHMALLAALGSTTSYLLLALAVLQFVLPVARRYPRLTLASAATATVAAMFGALWFGVQPADVADQVTSRLVGDQAHGFVARYASNGLLATNFQYVTENPLEPIGFDFSPGLYFGDSGVIITMMRGSVPLLLATYGGLFLFLRANLRSRRTAMWLSLMVLAFEVGFTPLQYFRFIGFLPFAVVYFNTVSARAAVAGTDASAAAPR